MSIYNHMTVGSADLAVSQQFYDACLAPLGIKNFGGVPDAMIFYGAEKPEFFVVRPINGESACLGNGVTIAFRAPSRAAVDAFHETGCNSGGSCEGKPGNREAGPPGNYVAYLRDPVGNKIAAVTYSES